ncbi:type II toxin-antitoxin system VapB family antitoxin [Rhizobium mongolense]|uniref:type II toxin-antitoxin system VapB family antitoxin n=1 Tax=Rhizobium mongolense TaxID=57676 RepID=UPI0034A250B3
MTEYTTVREVLFQFFGSFLTDGPNIRSEIVNQLAEELAAKKRISKTEAVRLALENELRRTDEKLSPSAFKATAGKIASYRDSAVGPIKRSSTISPANTDVRRCTFIIALLLRTEMGSFRESPR